MARRINADNKLRSAKLQRQAIVLDALRRGITVGNAVRLAGVSMSAYQAWRNNDPQFRVSANVAKGEGAATKGYEPKNFFEARKFYFGMHTFDHQAHLVTALDDLKPREITLVNLWPEAGKTTTMVDYMSWTLAKNPNHRFTVVSKSATLGEKILGRVKRRMTDEKAHARFLSDHGPFYEQGQERDGRPWSASGITVARSDHDEADFSIEVRGWNSSAYGIRIDTLIVDDIQSRENINDTTKILESLKQTYFTRGRRMRILIVGTRIGDGDVYERLLEEGIVDRHIILPALDHHGEVTVPDWWETDSEGQPAADVLAGIRRQVGEDAWWASYQQRPNSNELATFTDEMLESARDPLRKVTTHVTTFEALRVVAIDPALGGGNAMTAAACKPATLEVLDCLTRGGLARVEEILALLEDYLIRFRPQKVIVEVNAFQRALVDDDRMRALAAQYGFRAYPHQTGFNKVDSTLGVASMAGSFIRNEVTFPDGDDLSRTQMRPMVEQLRRWRPNIPPKLLVQDLPMTLWFIWRDWMAGRRSLDAPANWHRQGLPWRPTPLALPSGR